MHCHHPSEFNYFEQLVDAWRLLPAALATSSLAFIFAWLGGESSVTKLIVEFVSVAVENYYHFA